MQRDPDPASGQAVIELAGELDLAVAADLRALLDAVAADRPQFVVVDLADVGFIDSTVLRELLRVHRTVRADGGRLVMAGCHAAVKRLLALTGTTEVFELADSRAAALASAG